MVIPSFEKSHVSGVTVMQNTIVAFSLTPELCLMQWDGKTTYLTALGDFYSLILALFGGMAACRIYWSLCFTENQKLPEPLTGCSWCLQHAFCKTQHLLEMWEQLPSQAELARSVLPSHWTKVYRVWADFPFLYTPSWSAGVSANDFSPLTQQSRTFLYCELLHYHQEQVLVVLLTECWMVVTRRTGQVIWNSSKMTCVPQFFAACMIIIL